MSLDLTIHDVDAIWAEAEQQCTPVTSIDRLETIYTVPSQLGSGSHRVMELSPGLELRIFQETYTALSLRMAENQHPVQFMVYLSGGGVSEVVYQDATQSYIGGSGIQRAYTHCYPEGEASVGVDIEMQPHLLNQLFATSGGELPVELQPLVQGNAGQQVFSPQTTKAMRSVVQHIIDCSLVGATKRFYLQGKVFELMALQLDAAFENKNPAIAASLKPDTMARIHYAAGILRSQLEHPPAQAELAQRVGISYCTLHRGFRVVFGVTPFAYLTQQRMKQAEQLLRQPDCTVTKAAHRVGYTNVAQFGAAFKRQLGITPSDCIRGKKPTL
ncbi:MAG: helix-turn-helix domain-containing protein [Nodosilinea sp.]